MFGHCCSSLLNFYILRKNFFQIQMTGCWGNLRPKRAKPNDHMTRAALCKRSWMKNRKRRKSDSVGHLKFKKTVRIITFLRLAFKCFWSSNSSRSVIVVHIWANVLLCGAERRKRSGQGRLFSRWTEFLADDLKHFRQVQVYEVQPHWDKHSLQVFKLQAYLRSVRAVHISANVLLSGDYGRRSYEFHRWTMWSPRKFVKT